MLLFAACLSAVAAAQQWQNLTLYNPADERLFWESPSIEQATDFTLLGYQGYDAFSQYARRSLFTNNALAPALLDVGMWLFVLPEPKRWMQNRWQQEWLRDQGIASRSEAYYYWSEDPTRKAYVYGVSDAALADVKAHDPVTMVRLSTARYESSFVLGRQYAEDSFFNHAQPRYRLAKAHNVLFDLFNLYQCRENGRDDLPQSEPELQQDIVGYECRSWVYDLHRPDANYIERPQRYLRWDDLSQDEQDYLNQAFWFSWLNVVDGHLLAEVQEAEQNRLSFQPTPFGRSFGWHHLRYQRGLKMAWEFYLHQNRERSLPALSISIIDNPALGGLLTLRGHGWQQPDDLRFDSTSANEGWALEASFSRVLFGPLRAQADWHYKTAGWMPGVPSLDEGHAWQFGIDVRLFQ
ncbi:hypothetical protein ACFOSD_04975 [Salinispirillum marinum]|uniref:Alginate export domain-containing protein n=2 Tax=Saccharospirillaceae TaxID=255527 RepID=A0ABV8BEF4_9GAMM